jgi:hypothetical protein
MRPGEMAVQLMDRSGIPRLPAVLGTYDPMRIGQPDCMRRLNAAALAAEEDWERPWRHHHSSGDYDPFSIE